MLNYWNQTLENLLKDPRNDKFEFIVNNTVYEFPLSYAFAISPLITEKYLKDPTFNKLTIILNQNGKNNIRDTKIEEEFKKFIKREKISREIFYEIGMNLKNQEME